MATAKQTTTEIKTNCNSCDRETNQKVLYRTDPIVTRSAHRKHRAVTNIYCVIQCLGCSDVSFLHVEKHTGRLRADTATFYFNYPETDYSSIDEYDFLIEDDWGKLPRTIADLYSEIQDAFAFDSAILAGIGLRTLVEAICLDQNISGANLEKKIQGLLAKGLISSAELPILDKLRLIGNFSAHSIKRLPMGKLNYALSIINHILKSIYILPKLDKGLMKYMDKSYSVNKKK